MSTDLDHNKPDIHQLSTHLFWDTSIDRIDWKQHRSFIVERVMGYGRMEDWHLIKSWYGKEGLKSIVINLRDLDQVSMAFLALVLNLEKADFICSSRKQSQPAFWDR